MNYKILDNVIRIEGKKDFNIRHILDCGQIFAYQNNIVYSNQDVAVISETEKGFDIYCSDCYYFENFFDLKTDYSKIKDKLKKEKLLKKPIEFGNGIRILKNDIFEVMISFIISANNNIKRIQLILSKLREALGKKCENFFKNLDMKIEYYAFPTYEKLLSVDEQFFIDIGCGYRAKYLYNFLRQISMEEISNWKNLSTEELKSKLISLSGIGPKVADCILLFGYAKMDVFPVDTWINQMYNQYFEPSNNRLLIRKNLVSRYKDLSGYAQQYLFYYQRSK